MYSVQPTNVGFTLCLAIALDVISLLWLATPESELHNFTVIYFSAKKKKKHQKNTEYPTLTGLFLVFNISYNDSTTDCDYFFTSISPDKSKISKDVTKEKIIGLTKESKGVGPLKIHWLLIIFASLYWVLLRSYYTRVKQLIFTPSYLLPIHETFKYLNWTGDKHFILCDIMLGFSENVQIYEQRQLDLYFPALWWQKCLDESCTNPFMCMKNKHLKPKPAIRWILDDNLPVWDLNPLIVSCLNRWKHGVLVHDASVFSFQCELK